MPGSFSVVKLRRRSYKNINPTGFFGNTHADNHKILFNLYSVKQKKWLAQKNTQRKITIHQTGLHGENLKETISLCSDYFTC